MTPRLDARPPAPGGSVSPRTDATAVVRAAFVLGLLVCLLIGLPAGAQVDTAELERLEDEVDRYQELVAARDAEIERLDALLAETEADVTEAIRERDAVAAELQQVRLERDATRVRLERLRAERAATEADIAQAESELLQLQERIQGLLVNLHRRRAPRFAQVFGGTDSFHDLQVKNRFLGRLAEQDVAVVTELNDLLQRLTSLQTELSNQIAQQSAAEDALAEQEARLEASRAELASIVARLDASLDGQRAQRRAELVRQRELEEDLRELVTATAREAERIERERELRDAAEARLEERQREQQEQLRQNDLARAASEAPIADGVTAAGYFVPTRGRLAGSFAPSQGRSYIEIRATEARAPVRTVDEGEVVTTRWTGANDGFLVVIAHGGGLMSIYLNLRPPLVEAGDRVRGGQLLGYLGGGTLIQDDTLRLYVSSNGVFVDPVSRLGF